MILFVFVLVGIVAGLVMNRRSGKKNQLQGVSCIRGAWLPLTGILLHASFTFLPAVALQYAAVITTLDYACILVFLFLNRQRKVSAALMAVGSLSNYAVIAANRFRMPVSPAALSMYPGMTPEAVYAKKVNYFIALNGANLYPLGDIIPVPLRWLGAFISVGDLFIGVGLLLFIVWVLTMEQQEETVAA